MTEDASSNLAGSIIFRKDQMKYLKSKLLAFYIWLYSPPQYEDDDDGS